VVLIDTLSMGVRRGGQDGALAPLGCPKKYVFRLFRRKIIRFRNFLDK
jgi:hypothetical protein